MLGCICDPLWEKVQFRANNEFELCMNMAVQVKPHYGMKGNYDPLPCSYRWNNSDPPILEPAAPCQNCMVDISAISAWSITEQIPRSTSTLPLHIIATSWGTSDCFVHPTALQSKRFVSIRTSKCMPP